MNISDALKKFRALGYRRGPAAQCLMIAATEAELNNILIPATVRTMQSGTAKADFHAGTRTITMEGTDARIFFSTPSGIEWHYGRTFPFVLFTYDMLGGMTTELENRIRLLHRSDEVSESEFLWSTVSGL